MAEMFPKHPNLVGGYEPLLMECDVHDMRVEGEVPSALNGSFYRNGPNPQFAPRGGYHLFGGDGMIHAFHIENGKISYRNRWARTKKWHLERNAGRALFNPFDPSKQDPSVSGVVTDGLANTNIVWHAGRLLALEEGHAPFELDPHTLESKGCYTYGGKLKGPMTAHPKIDYESGEMLFFGYNADGGISPAMTFNVVDRTGRLVRSESFEAPYASMVHDFMVTSDYILFPIMPLTGSIERAMSGLPVYAWEPDKSVHVGVMPRNGSVNEMRWFTGEAAYVFHPMNSFSIGEIIYCDVCEYPQAPLFPFADGSPGDPKKANANLVRWTFDLSAPTDTYKRQQLDDLDTEFPRLDERRTGLNYRYGFMAADSKPKNRVGGFDMLCRVDLENGTRDVYEAGPGVAVSEPVFVPRTEDSVEGDGFLLAYTYDANRRASNLLIFDALDLQSGPIANGYLDHRIPFGFHGNWRENAIS